MSVRSGGARRRSTEVGEASGRLCPCIAVLLADVRHFIKDCLEEGPLNGLTWLLAVARSVPGVVTGLEKPEATATASCRQVLEGALVVERPWVVVLNATSHAQQQNTLQQLQPLVDLKFHAGGGVAIVALDAPQPVASWSFVFQHVLPAYRRKLKQQESQWFIEPDFLGEEGDEPELAVSRDADVSVDSIRILPTFYGNGKLFLFLVRDTSGSRGFRSVWTTIGGGVKRGKHGDRDLSATLRREWDEEVLAFPWQHVLGDSGSDMQAAVVVWKRNSATWENQRNCYCQNLKHGQGISSVRWCFAAASREFFKETVGRPVQLCLADLEVARKASPPELKKRVHTHGITFVEHDVGAWFQLDSKSGALLACCDIAGVRGDLGHGILQQDSRRKRIVDIISTSSESYLEDLDELQWFLVGVTPDGLRNKLPVIRANFRSLTPEAATKELTACVLSEDPLYPEVIQVLLEMHADPGGCEDLLRESAVTSPLEALLRKTSSVCESVASKTTKLLLDAYRRKNHEISEPERRLIREWADRASPRFQKQWQGLRDFG